LRAELILKLLERPAGERTKGRAGREDEIQQHRPAVVELVRQGHALAIRAHQHHSRSFITHRGARHAGRRRDREQHTRRARQRSAEPAWYARPHVRYLLAAAGVAGAAAGGVAAASACGLAKRASSSVRFTSTASITILWVRGLPSFAVSYRYGTMTPCTDLKSRWLIHTARILPSMRRGTPSTLTSRKLFGSIHTCCTSPFLRVSLSL